MKKGFTLVELLVSILLFGLITVILFGTIDNLRAQLSFFKEKERHLGEKNQILSLMRGDYDRPASLKILATSEKNFNTVSISGSNRSLYGIYRPNVIWMVIKSDNTLIRLESASPITLPLRPESIYQIHSDVVGKECEIFRVYESSSGRMIYIKFTNESPLIVETKK
ncbi:N-terminal methylation motif domain protein [Sulfuricurvum kujiense DSM 16994]|uniref:N-terminal methylation motif domain protein n=1 Tax=Sulfuricurvum kujiense (strain ATCC BAA-921 / DSM 16994 / JCM 11577 / YK-1) TaxID=709032 RepID=E4TX36_SULKY|nr:prepilin-type N-terminal cleavage/methylation domain-containing protein [Sulfuricurvum kujiense]ADR33877.1 N-terminal methylation motif domain protein [Sulfuricurvum kujiense DSM 16994]